MDTLTPPAKDTFDAPAPQRGCRLLLLRPVPPADGREGPVPASPLPCLLPATSVDVAYLAGAPTSYMRQRDCARAEPLVVDRARQAEREGYDAVVVSCMLDPGVDAARRAVAIPVIGVAEATIAIARMLGARPSRFFTRDIPVERLGDDEEETARQLVAVGRSLVTGQGADVLVPNCSRLSPLALRLSTAVSVPVLPNEPIGLKVAELIATLGLRRSRPWGDASLMQRLRRAASRLRWRLRLRR
jgi:allantoin racemase